MANNISQIELRGMMAKLARAKNVGMDAITRFDVNQQLKKDGFNPLTGNEMAPIIAELMQGPYPPTKFYSFEYWYNYFYNELPTGGINQKMKYAVFVINDDGSFRTEEQVPNKTTLFQEMLTMGFKEFQATDHLSAQEVLADAALDYNNVLQNREQDKVNILFRGDGRSCERIRNDKGTRPQSRVDELRRDHNMLKDWHPFNNQGNSVWVRNGEVNKDNCLYSAVSVTPQFFVATKFPLLGDLKASNPGAIGHAVVVVRPRTLSTQVAASAFQQAQKRFAPPEMAGEERSVILTASKTNIYGVRMAGVYRTQNYQGKCPFPEYASDDLSWSDHLVWLSVTRIHFSEVDGNAGHLIVINEHRWLQDERMISAALLGPGSVAALKAFVDDIVRRGRLDNGVGGIEYTPTGFPPPNFEIVRVRESFIAGRNEPTSPVTTEDVHPQTTPKKLVIPPAFQH